MVRATQHPTGIATFSVYVSFLHFELTSCLFYRTYLQPHGLFRKISLILRILAIVNDVCVGIHVGWTTHHRTHLRIALLLLRGSWLAGLHGLWLRGSGQRLLHCRLWLLHCGLLHSWLLHLIHLWLLLHHRLHLRILHSLA